MKHNIKNHILNLTQKRIEAAKNNDKDAKALCKLVNNTIYGKAMGKKD